MNTEISYTPPRPVYSAIAERLVGGQLTPAAATRRDLVVLERAYVKDFWAALRPDSWTQMMTVLLGSYSSIWALIGFSIAAPPLHMAMFCICQVALLGMIWTDTLAKAKWDTEEKRLG